MASKWRAQVILPDAIKMGVGAACDENSRDSGHYTINGIGVVGELDSHPGIRTCPMPSQAILPDAIKERGRGFGCNHKSVDVSEASRWVGIGHESGVGLSKVAIRPSRMACVGLRPVDIENYVMSAPSERNIWRVAHTEYGFNAAVVASGETCLSRNAELADPELGRSAGWLQHPEAPATPQSDVMDEILIVGMFARHLPLLYAHFTAVPCTSPGALRRELYISLLPLTLPGMNYTSATSLNSRVTMAGQFVEQTIQILDQTPEIPVNRSEGEK
ncbi:hypothetical protein DFH07DRAFT_942273 [Mycena maculata]|uniref:Uncharacterized protein n=1 Tax=Mycena maculata TaxID=230809 RepID=A0AAD7IRR9_9AGAR|nr:hypothetical protein DFH07DRAFT_942273 [Mycena maculata]